MTSSGHREVRQVRIDIPLRSTYLYFFVSPDRATWNSWWGEFFDYLTGAASMCQSWKYDPEQDVYIARPQLTQEQRSDLVRFIRTAPLQEIKEHRTLRRAVEMTPEQEKGLQLVYFSEGSTA